PGRPESRHPGSPIRMRPTMRSRRSLLLLALLLSACSGVRSYSRSTLAPLTDAFTCSAQQLEAMEYEIELADSIGGLLQGRREITGLTESARRGAAAATEVLTAGLAGGRRTRFDELTVFVYMR